MPNKTIRIGGGQGFWGDWLEAPLQLVEKGDIDYLVLDYLAEVTMSILAKQKERDPALGYAKDFPLLIHELAPHIKDKKVKIIANAGGLNPRACAKKCLELLSSIPGMNSIPTIAVVTGDDILPRKDELEKKGVSFSHLENSSPISSINHALKSMNAYVGGESITEALKNGADIVITGRVADPCMTLAALAHEFSWDYSNWDLLASGVIAGHVIECGAHVTGGNFSGGWEQVPDTWNIGFPVIECSEDGSFVVTKPENTGGLVTIQTVSEQLIYEIGDPEHYITPDVIADFTSITVTDLGNNRVKVSPAKENQNHHT
jgi:hypothetical protein